MRSGSLWTWNTLRKSSATKSSCFTVTRHRFAPLITHRFTTGACVTTLTGSRISEDHRTTSSIIQRGARTFQTMAAGNNVSITLTVNTHTRWLRFCSTLWTTSWTIAIIRPHLTRTSARYSESSAAMHTRPKRRSKRRMFWRPRFQSSYRIPTTVCSTTSSSCQIT